MTAEQEQRMKRLKYYGSWYEIVLTNGADSYLVSYSSRYYPGALRDALRNNLEDVLRITGGQPPAIVYDGGPCSIGQEWRILFSGRTERQCILGKELPSVGASSLQQGAVDAILGGLIDGSLPQYEQSGFQFDNDFQPK